MLRFDKATYLSLLFKFILCEGLSSSLQGSDVLLFSEFLIMASILYYTFMEFIILLHTFLVIFFARCKEHIIWRISFSKFSDVLPIVNLWSICLGVNISSHTWSETLAMPATSKGYKQSDTLVTQANTPGRPFPCICFHMWKIFLQSQ